MLPQTSPGSFPPPYTPMSETSRLTTTTATTASQDSTSRSITTPDTQHEDLAAAEALTQLVRNPTPPSDGDMIGYASSADGSPLNTSLPLPPIQLPPPQQHPLVSTVSMVAQHPLVKNAVRYYETSKRNYPTFNYAAGIVEKAALPVVNKIEVNLNTRHQSKQASSGSVRSSSISSSNELTPIVSDDGDHKQRKRRLGRGDEETNGKSDTKKRIQFCLHVLRLANDNINNKIQFLQEKVTETEIAVKEEREKLQQSSQQQQQTENQFEAQKTKNEIVTTVKKIIHLISNFRPSSLSTDSLTPIPSNGSTASTATTNQEYELKTAIRDIILHLPNALQQTGATSPGGTQHVANDRVLIFAKESLEMISKLTQVFHEQLSKAENWVSGEEQLQQQQQQQEAAYDTDDDMRSTSTRCSSAEPEGITKATKRMKLDCPSEKQ
ncbi:OPI1 [[Candida] subhashii]|uniref:OPI1 n=1 Tax=[Candida] subhashii TaxID=561895 RepID=A0A8J5QTE1_9ASCO|nr:OPI1 [[Candida] subhashii]KAG7665963.1 OPI1 [[Candida] subhashii]